MQPSSKAGLVRHGQEGGFGKGGVSGKSPTASCICSHGKGSRSDSGYFGGNSTRLASRVEYAFFANGGPVVARLCCSAIRMLIHEVRSSSVRINEALPWSEYKNKLVKNSWSDSA